MNVLLNSDVHKDLSKQVEEMMLVNGHSENYPKIIQWH